MQIINSKTVISTHHSLKVRFPSVSFEGHTTAFSKSNRGCKADPGLLELGVLLS